MPQFHTQQHVAATPIATLKAHHIAIRVPDYTSALRWYVEKLGCRIVQEWPFGDMRLAYVALPQDDAFYFELIGDGEVREAPQYHDIPSSMARGGYHHLCLQVDNVDAALAYLREQGVSQIGEPFDLNDINRRLGFFADPWGNLFELAQIIESQP